MKMITTEKMPRANGHYSQCIEHNGMLYMSGQLPIDPATRAIAESIEKQTAQALSNVETILTEAGSAKENVLQMRIYISDIKLWDKVNAVYSEFFGSHRPVRCVVPSRDLHFGCLIEIEATALISR